MNNNTPFIAPILALLRSRKVMIAFVTLLVNALIVLEPSLESVQSELMAVLTTIGTALIAAIAYEDAAGK